jgi:hypothetical protein
MDEIHVVKALVDGGLNDCAIARQTGIPRRTVAQWRITQRWSTASSSMCSKCDGSSHGFDTLPREYVYLLGMYLGDGYIVRGAKRVFRLIVAMDGLYPRLIAECVDAIATLTPGARPYVQSRKNTRCVWVVKAWKHWPCVFPQHGPGPKHTRPIVLAAWQERLVRRDPELFLRGLLHSDGCRSMNTIRHGDKLYAYPRYNFTNASADIRKLFCETCDLLGIEWRVMNARNISVARRGSVARLDEFVGPKR